MNEHLCDCECHGENPAAKHGKGKDCNCRPCENCGDNIRHDDIVKHFMSCVQNAATEEAAAPRSTDGLEYLTDEAENEV